MKNLSFFKLVFTKVMGEKNEKYYDYKEDETSNVPLKCIKGTKVTILAASLDDVEERFRATYKELENIMDTVRKSNPIAFRFNIQHEKNIISSLIDGKNLASIEIDEIFDEYIYSVHEYYVAINHGIKGWYVVDVFKNNLVTIEIDPRFPKYFLGDFELMNVVDNTTFKEIAEELCENVLNVDKKDERYALLS